MTIGDRKKLNFNIEYFRAQQSGSLVNDNMPIAIRKWQNQIMRWLDAYRDGLNAPSHLRVQLEEIQAPTYSRSLAAGFNY